MTEPTSEEIAAAANEAVTLFLRELGSDLSTGRFVLVVESVDEDGKLGIWTAEAAEQPIWVSLGLLEYGKTIGLFDPDDGSDVPGEL